jgi:hypothetical protein
MLVDLSETLDVDDDGHRLTECGSPPGLTMSGLKGKRIVVSVVAGGQWIAWGRRATDLRERDPAIPTSIPVTCAPLGVIPITRVADLAELSLAHRAKHHRVPIVVGRIVRILDVAALVQEERPSVYEDA